MAKHTPTTSYTDACTSFPDQRCSGWRGCEKVCERVKYKRDRARAERSKAVRSFEMPRHAEHMGDMGFCRWCGGEILHLKGKRVGERNSRRTWHPECLYVYQLHTDRIVQQGYLSKRDGIGCADCGAPKGRYVRVWVMSTEAALANSAETHPWLREAVGPLTVIMWRSHLTVDHHIPLWSVEHLPAEERRRYFGPTNLKLRCDPCHAVKTKAEAAERAALRREQKNAPPGLSSAKSPNGA